VYSRQIDDRLRSPGERRSSPAGGRRRRGPRAHEHPPTHRRRCCRSRASRLAAGAAHRAADPVAVRGLRKPARHLPGPAWPRSDLPPDRSGALERAPGARLCRPAEIRRGRRGEASPRMPVRADRAAAPGGDRPGECRARSRRAGRAAAEGGIERPDADGVPARLCVAALRRDGGVRAGRRHRPCPGLRCHPRLQERHPEQPMEIAGHAGAHRGRREAADQPRQGPGARGAQGARHPDPLGHGAQRRADVEPPRPAARGDVLRRPDRCRQDRAG